MYITRIYHHPMQGNYIHVIKDPQATQTWQYSFFNPVFRTFYFLIIDEMFVSVLRPLRSPPSDPGHTA